jgi:hypothetical protein
MVLTKTSAEFGNTPMATKNVPAYRTALFLVARSMI